MTYPQFATGCRIMIIMRGLSPADTATAANRAWDLGVGLVEVPIGQPGQEKALAAAVEAGAKRGKRVGAGTIVSCDHVEAAVDAGAAYTVAPGFDLDVLLASHEAGLPHIPGVATPSEIQTAWGVGCQWMKAFPASVLGPGWFKAVAGPFPNVRLLATGGVTLKTAPDYLRAGASVIGFGAAILDTNPTGLAEAIEAVETP